MSAAAQIGDFDTLVASYLKAQEDLAEVFGAQCGIGCGTCAKCELVSAASQSLILQIEAFNHQIENFGSALKVPEVVPEDLKDPEVVPVEELKEAPKNYFVTWVMVTDRRRQCPDEEDAVDDSSPPHGACRVPRGRAGTIEPFGTLFNIEVLGDGCVWLSGEEDNAGHMKFRVGQVIMVELPSDHGPGFGIRILVTVAEQETPPCIKPVDADIESLEPFLGRMVTIVNRRLDCVATCIPSGRQVLFHLDDETLELKLLEDDEGRPVVEIIDDTNMQAKVVRLPGAGHHQFAYHDGEEVYDIFITPEDMQPTPFVHDDDSDSEDVPPAKGSRKRQRSPSKSPSPKRHCS
jgi:hypothetical protein